jgi:hypothetical protein
MVIKEVGKTNKFSCPTIIGLCEIENNSVLEDLIKSENLNACNYGIVHYDCWYERGVDVALLYQKKHFIVLNSKPYRLVIPENPDFKTRDILLVSGLLDGELTHFIVNHWPSRRGGEKASAPLRNAAASLCRHIVDSLYQTDSIAKIIIMGDFNDDPINESITNYLKAKPSINKTSSFELYNPMYELYKKGIGSLAYNDKWNLFDQIIVSYPFIHSNGKGYKYVKAGVFNKPFLVQKEGQFAGYPFRTYVGNTYMGGYSDHFPSYLILSK